MSNETITKIKATADILGGTVFFANENGIDPEYLSNGGLLPNGMYIRLEGSDGSVAYISAYEIDRLIKNIDEISKIKANQSDLEALIQSVNEKVSSTELELLKAEVDGKISISEYESIRDNIEAKADKTVVDELITAVSTKADSSSITELSEQISNKADKETVTQLETDLETKALSSDVEALQADVAALEETLKVVTNTNSINSINAQIAYLNEEIAKRLTVDDLRSINTNITNLTTKSTEFEERVSNVEANLSKKATTTYVQGQVSTLNNTITDIIKVVENKANTSEVSAKANKSDLDTLTTKINALTTNLNNIAGEVSSNYTELNNDIKSKADNNTVSEQINAINSTLITKADKAVVNEAIDRINNKLSSLEDSQDDTLSEISGDIEELECEFNNIVSELRSSLNSNLRTLENHQKQITKLETSSSDYSDQLKQTWVRVLTTNEYKKLTNPPEGVPYHPRYKYPNTVYMVVDFNKPKAIYIGDILVAKAEQSGSIGFAYTFPIVF